MNRLLVVLCLAPALALGAEGQQGSSADPMAGWVPPKVKAEAKDKQEIQALLRSMETASRTGDLEAAAALVDFPVTMITDDSKGEGKAVAWDREKWTQVMTPFYGHPKKDMKITHRPNVFLLSDSLGVVNDVATMTEGGKTITTRSSMLVIRRDGRWRVKTMPAGGSGHMMGANGPASASPGPGSSGGTGAGASEPSRGEGTGSGEAAPPAGQGSGTQEPTGRTTR